LSTRPSGSSEGSKSQDRATKAFLAALSVALVWISLSVYFTLPENVVSSRSAAFTAVRSAMITLSPQTWGFFTNPPQREEYGVYDIETASSLLRTPQTRAENAFGLTRAQRAQGPELAVLAATADNWQDCSVTDGREICFDAAQDLPPTPVENSAAHRTICGDVILTLETPNPFAYRDFDLEDHTLTKFQRVNVEC